jgi:signal transduction histidine kinase
MATPGEAAQEGLSDSLGAQLDALRQAHDGLLHAVSHDLRAPLRHITSFAPLLRESVQALRAGAPGADAEAEQFLATMEQAARRMAGMIDALLLLSRAQRTPLNPGPLDLAALAREASARLHAAAPQRAVEWQLPAAPVPLHADAALLRQLLDALLGNAFKFTQGCARARIALTVEPQPGGLCWRVQDDGAGFDPARAQGLFGLFQRLHREGEFDGVGGGLALAQAIVQRHGGRIGATAQPGAGCVVTVHWPVAPAQPFPGSVAA